jgi:hypothetical protein
MRSRPDCPARKRQPGLDESRALGTYRPPRWVYAGEIEFGGDDAFEFHPGLVSSNGTVVLIIDPDDGVGVD